MNSPVESQLIFTFIIGLIESSECSFLFSDESPSTFLYSTERQTLFCLMEHHIPKFDKLTKKKKLDIILRGINIENDDFL